MEKDDAVLAELQKQSAQIRYLVDDAAQAVSHLEDIKALLERIAKALEGGR